MAVQDRGGLWRGAALAGVSLIAIGQASAAQERSITPAIVRSGDRITIVPAAAGDAAPPSEVPARRVRVAIAATGDELVPAGQPIGPDQLPETNCLMLAGLLADLPVDRIDLGILPDRMDALVDALPAGAAWRR